jgi:hypothetical protein
MVVVGCVVSMVLLLTWAGWWMNDRPRNECLAEHPVCIDTTDGWKPYEEATDD